MNLKTSLLLILLMILITQTISGEPNENQTTDSMKNTESEKTESEELTWTDTEVQELIEEMKKIKNEAIDEAVKKAVIPLIAELEVMKIKIEERDDRITDLETELDTLKSQNIVKTILVGAGGIGLGFLLGFFTFSHSGGA